MIIKESFIQVMLNSTPKTMTKKQKCREKKEKKTEKSAQKKVNGCKNKERLQKMTCDRFTGLSEEEKDKKEEYTRNRFQNMYEADREN